MKCANSSRLNTLIRLYPKILYSIRAFTHALAYFNSCLNPYLYAILNRNFCLDLVDIIPAWRPCCKQAVTLKNGHSRMTSAFLSPNQTLVKRYSNHNQDDESEYHYHEQKQTTNDACCQVELLRIQPNDYSKITDLDK